MSFLNEPHHLQRKVKQQVDSLNEEVKEVLMSLNLLRTNLSQFLNTTACCLQRLGCCQEENIVKTFQQVCQELEVMDEQITILRVTMSSTEFALEEELVFMEDTWQDITCLSKSSNYLLRKVSMKVASLKREEMVIRKHFLELQSNAEKIVEKAKVATKKIFTFCNTDNMLEIYKEISKELGSLDMEITMIRVTVSRWVVVMEEAINTSVVGDNEGNVENVHKTHKIVELYIEVEKNPSEVKEDSYSNMNYKNITTKDGGRKDVSDDSSAVVINKTADEVQHHDKVEIVETSKADEPESKHQQIHVKDIESKLLEKKTEDFELEELFAKKLEENPKLARICRTSVLNKQVVKDRVKENLSKSRLTCSSKSAASEHLKSTNKVVDIRVTVSTGNMKSSNQLYTTSLNDLPVDTSDMVETHKRQQLDSIKKKFGEYGNPFKVGEYKEFKMSFDSGCPGMFWMHVTTDAMFDLQDVIQRRLRGRPDGDGGGEIGLEVGSVVLARYTMDKEVYRAKVEEVIDGEKKVVSVRYLDYGNYEDCLTLKDLYSWDPVLEKISPQAVPCTFDRAPRTLRENTRLTGPQMEAFTSLMKKSSPMRMVVHERLVVHNIFSPSAHQLGPELTVSLYGKDGKDVLTSLSHLTPFRHYFIQQKQGLVVPSLTQHNIQQLHALLPPRKLRSVPKPLHLVGEELAVVYKDDLPSPVHANTASKAVEKVQWWLDREKNEDQQQIETGNFRFQEHKFVEIEDKKTGAFLPRKPVTCLSPYQKEDVYPSENVEASEQNQELTGKSDPVLQNYLVQASPFLDKLAVPESDGGQNVVSTPSLTMQKVELDGNGEFQFMVSHIVSPEEVYVHPLQETSGKLDKLEREMERMTEGENVASEVDVLVGSIWAVYQQAWFRVRVLRVEYGKVELQTLDHGHYLLAVDAFYLHHLPAGMASRLPGLAVRCHMARVRPVQQDGWDNVALQVLTHCLEGEEVNTALQVEMKDGSLGIVVLLERQGMFNTVNQRLVEVGCAISSVFDSQLDEGEDSGLLKDWDPMAEDYNSTTNSYMEDSLGCGMYHVPG